MNQLSKIPFGNTTITIYNKYQAKNASGKLITKWLRTVIPNCFRGVNNTEIKIGNTTIGANNSLVKIPLFEEFVSAYDWTNLVNDEYANHFTVSQGDLIVLREVSDEVEPTLGVIDDIEDKYGSLAFYVSNVNLNYGVGIPLQHIEAVG